MMIAASSQNDWHISARLGMVVLRLVANVKIRGNQKLAWYALLALMIDQYHLDRTGQFRPREMKDEPAGLPLTVEASPQSRYSLEQITGLKREAINSAIYGLVKAGFIRKTTRMVYNDGFVVKRSYYKIEDLDGFIHPERCQGLEAPARKDPLAKQVTQLRKLLRSGVCPSCGCKHSVSLLCPNTGELVTLATEGEDSQRAADEPAPEAWPPTDPLDATPEAVEPAPLGRGAGRFADLKRAHRWAAYYMVAKSRRSQPADSASGEAGDRHKAQWRWTPADDSSP